MSVLRPLACVDHEGYGGIVRDVTEGIAERLIDRLAALRGRKVNDPLKLVVHADEHTMKAEVRDVPGAVVELFVVEEFDVLKGEHKGFATGLGLEANRRADGGEGFGGDGRRKGVFHMSFFSRFSNRFR